MRRVARIGGYAGALVALVALWLVAMVVTGMVLEERTRRRIAERIGESLQAEATIERGDLALVRGAIDLEGLTVKRDDLIGHLAIVVPSMHCELPPLGWALVDRDCRSLAVRGPRLEVSSAALFRLKRPKRPPLHAERVVIDDARLEFSPSALAPSLGKVTIAVAHAEAGETVFKTPVSWIFSLRELRARVDLPGDITLDLTYAGGLLHVSGGMFGATPIALPVALPVADATDDAQGEIAKLSAFGREIAQRLITSRAADWIKSKLAP